MDSVFTVWFGNHRSWSKSHALYAGVNGLSHACAPLEPRRASQPIDVGLLNARAVKRKVWNEAESRAQSETGERHFFFLAPHMPYGRARLARFALKTLTPRFTDFFTDFEKKKLAVLQSTPTRTTISGF